jgi:cytochrome b pre-mRNA-processing protein 3
MKVKRLFWRRTSPVERLYAAIVASARQPSLYGNGEMPDSLEGRVLAIVLHLAVAVNRLKQLGEREAAQDLVEAFFADVEGNLREAGVSDPGIPKRMRAIEALYVHAMKQVEPALGSSAAVLSEAIRESLPQLLAGRELQGVTAHVASAHARLAGQASRDILQGEGWLP